MSTEPNEREVAESDAAAIAAGAPVEDAGDSVPAVVSDATGNAEGATDEDPSGLHEVGDGSEQDGEQGGVEEHELEGDEEEEEDDDDFEDVEPLELIKEPSEDEELSTD